MAKPRNPNFSSPQLSSSPPRGSRSGGLAPRGQAASVGGILQSILGNFAVSEKKPPLPSGNSPASPKKGRETVLQRRAKRYRFVLEWEKIVGPDAAANCAPARLVGEHVLLVRVSHPLWAQELSMQSGAIIERLRAVDPTSLVDSLRFEVGHR